MVVQVLYTVQGIQNVLHYDTTWKILEAGRGYYGRYWNTMEYCPELNRRGWKLIETTGYHTVLGSVDPYSYPYHQV